MNTLSVTVPSGPALLLTPILFPFRYFFGFKMHFALGSEADAIVAGVLFCFVSSGGKIKLGYLCRPCGFSSREPKSLQTTSKKEARSVPP